jgi:hypothetical protein
LLQRKTRDDWGVGGWKTRHWLPVGLFKNESQNRKKGNAPNNKKTNKNYFNKFAFFYPEYSRTTNKNIL